MMVSFVLSFFPRDVLDEILNLIESVSEDFPSYFSTKYVIVNKLCTNEGGIKVIPCFFFSPVQEVVVVELLFYVHGKHLRSCRDGQLT